MNIILNYNEKCQKNHRKLPTWFGWLTDWLSMVLRLHQHNTGYTADGFYRSDDPPNSIKALKEDGSSSRQALV